MAMRFPTCLPLAAVCFSGMFGAGGCAEAPPKKEAPAMPAPVKVREPAVAGSFYPADPDKLRAEIDQYLKQADPKLKPGETVRALICPHAGYIYSGPTAAWSFKTLEGRKFNQVLVLAPSHTAMFKGVALPDADGCRTPLGVVPVGSLAAKLAHTPPFAVDPPAQVRGPRGVVRAAPGGPSPHTYEHAAEVEIPFLQRVLPGCPVLPAILGEVDEAAVAAALLPLLDDETLLVASSDLSHYHSYAEARELDTDCVRTICALDIEHAHDKEACGIAPIVTLLHIAKKKGWQPRLLDYRNSGDTAGEKDRVVGYAAIAFVSTNGGSAAAAGAAAETAVAAQFSAEERKALLDLARQTVTAVSAGRPAPTPDTGKMPKSFLEKKGCFVTLTQQGRLRGCIGHIIPIVPLWEAIVDNATSASQHDPRFVPVGPAEVAGLEIEVSVLTQPQPLAFNSPEDLLAKLVPNRDGVVLRRDGHQATFLPQVWEQLPQKEEFLGALSQKAGMDADGWRGKGTTVQIYHVEAFKETEHK